MQDYTIPENNQPADIPTPLKPHRPHHQSHRNLIFAGIGFIALTSIIMLSVANINKITQFFSSASVDKVDYTVTVSNQPSNVGENVTVSITLTPHNHKVTAADLYMTYNPSSLQFVSANLTNSLNTLTNEPAGSGVHRLAFVVPCQTSCTSIQSPTTVAQVTFKVLAAGSSQIGFDASKTATAAINSDNTNVTGDLTPATITVGGGGGGTCNTKGDANKDGKVDGLDYVILFDNWHQNIPPGDTRADFNCDKTINGLDYVILFDNWTRS